MYTDEELAIQRQNTEEFINSNPMPIVLTRRGNTRTVTGAYEHPDGRLLPTQLFKLIMVSPSGGSIEQRSDDGTERRIDFVLLGNYDADVQIGDYWHDDTGQRWEVVSLVPFNGYQVQANVESYGKRPQNG